MLRFYAASFASAIGALQRAAVTFQTANFLNIPEDAAADRLFIRDTLNEASPALTGLPLSRVVRDQFQRMVARIDKLSGIELKLLLEEFNNNLLTELCSAWFLMIPAEKREFYEQRLPPFGESVSHEFSEAVGDIAAASRCYALDEWTACAFHLMRILEHGLRALAAEVNLDPESMAHENWKNVIDLIEKKIREMEKLPKSPEKIEQLRILSEAATQFRYFKDAWRNHVSHSRISYDEHTAIPIWQHVKMFMQKMAEIVGTAAII